MRRAQRGTRSSRARRRRRGWPQLGQGEGAKDVSDQIDNEDMLDGAFQNPEDGRTRRSTLMSNNFDSNL